jgi:REP element-mobilizing transposase RayT
MRKIIPGQPHHVFQRSSDKGLLFYTAADVLAYFTIYMTYARTYRITVLGVCPMRDHVHGMIIPPSKESMAKFEGATNRAYAVEFNIDTGTKGPLFAHSYGCAARKDMKKRRSSIIYLYNNPVEKHLCDKAIDAR